MTKPTMCVFWEGEPEYQGWGTSLDGAIEDFIERETEHCYPMLEDWHNLKMGRSVLFYVSKAIHDLKLSHFFNGSFLHDRLNELFYELYDSGFEGEQYAEDLSSYMDDAFEQWMKDHRVKWPFVYCSEPNAPQIRVIAYIRWNDGNYEDGAPIIHTTKRCDLNRKGEMCFAGVEGYDNVWFSPAIELASSNLCEALS